jgi:hypothetical protein
MSNSLAIAAVTSTLRAILQTVTQESALSDTIVTTQPPDKARTGNTNQINIFLYQTLLNVAWRNRDMPRQVQPGETGLPALPLNLHYLITVYGRDHDDSYSHQLLGRAMSLLHDYPLLSPEQIQSATSVALPDNNLADQIELVRLTYLPLTSEDIFKMWSGFQTHFRLSAAYEASLVLIESTRPSKTPLPVLTRGQDDKGITAQGSLIPPYPTLTEIQLPNGQTAAYLGDNLILNGHHLRADTLTLQLTNLRLLDALVVTPSASATDDQITFTIPDSPADYVAGVYTVAVVLSKTDGSVPNRTTNELPMVIAPRILAINPNPAARDAGGNVTVTIKCSPQVRPAQRVSLLVGDREVFAQPHPTQTDTLTFRLEKAEPGDFYLRLRVDGVDSLLVNRATTPPTFDPTQRVTINP